MIIAASIGYGIESEVYTEPQPVTLYLRKMDFHNIQDLRINLEEKISFWLDVATENLANGHLNLPANFWERLKTLTKHISKEVYNEPISKVLCKEKKHDEGFGIQMLDELFLDTVNKISIKSAYTRQSKGFA